MEQLLRLLLVLGALALLVIIGGIVYAVNHIFGEIVGGIILMIIIFLIIVIIEEQKKKGEQ